MKIIRIKKGHYQISRKGKSLVFELIKCDLLKNWTVYGFANRQICGGCTKKEALENLLNFINKKGKI